MEKTTREGTVVQFALGIHKTTNFPNWTTAIRKKKIYDYIHVMQWGYLEDI